MSNILARCAPVGVSDFLRQGQHPDRKGKVESAIGFAQKTPLRGKRYEELESATAELDHWTSRWADTRIHGTTKRQVAAMFAEEHPKLLQLPVEPFRFYEYSQRTVHLDGCVEVAAAYYSAPPGWIGRAVNVQWDERLVRLLDPATGTLLREHRRQPRGWRRVAPEDRPERTPPGTLKVLARARSAGTAIGAVCDDIHARMGESGVRRVLGILALVKKHGVRGVEDACQAALDVHCLEYRFVKKWIERHPRAPIELRQIDPLIRELSEYRKYVENLTSSNPSP